MPAQYDEYLIKDDELWTSHLNEAERRYLLENIGKPRRFVDSNPPPPPAIPSACAFVMDRMRDEPEEVRTIVKERIKSSLEFDKVLEGRRLQFGHIDYSNIGIGTGIGQHTQLDIFNVILSEKTRPQDGIDWAADFRTESGAPVVVNPKALAENRQIVCPADDCNHTTTGQGCQAAMGRHIKAKHRELQKEWREKILPEINKQFSTVEGIVAAGGVKGLAKKPAAQTEDERLAGVTIKTPTGTMTMEAKDV